jgi:signal transduction histidine kinase
MKVSDTGIGMSDEQLTRIFQPFSQADASISRRFGGTGLGLSITRRIAALLGGTTVASSTLGAGSTFELDVSLRLEPCDGSARDGWVLGASTAA